MRVGDAERDACMTALGEHYGAGRLDLAEFQARVDTALRARTDADLAGLLADLPAPGRAPRHRPRRPRWLGRLRADVRLVRGRAVLAAAGLVTVVAAGAAVATNSGVGPDATFVEACRPAERVLPEGGCARVSGQDALDRAVAAAESSAEQAREAAAEAPGSSAAKAATDAAHTAARAAARARAAEATAPDAPATKAAIKTAMRTAQAAAGTAAEAAIDADYAATEASQ